MKKYYFLASIIFICFAFSSCTSAPDVCDCINNAVKINTSQFDADLQKKCTDYSKTLSQKENEERVKEAIRRGCLK